MTLHSISLDVTGALAPPRTCPQCGDDLAASAHDEGVRFSCEGCGRSWSLALGRLVPVRRDGGTGAVPRQRVPS